MILDDNAAQWEEFDRRSNHRTRIARGASLLFASQRGVRACLVRDVSRMRVRAFARKIRHYCRCTSSCRSIIFAPPASVA